jgi:hypothetical protein
MEVRQDKCVIKFHRIKNQNKDYCLGICMKARKDFVMANVTITNRNVKNELTYQLLGHPDHNTTRAIALKLG